MTLEEQYAALRNEYDSLSAYNDGLQGERDRLEHTLCDAERALARVEAERDALSVTVERCWKLEQEWITAATLPGVSIREGAGLEGCAEILRHALDGVGAARGSRHEN